MKFIYKTATAIFLALLMLLGSAMANKSVPTFKAINKKQQVPTFQATDSSTDNQSSGDLPVYSAIPSSDSQSSGDLPIFAEYANSTQNILRATIDGERITFYLASLGLELSDSIARAAYLAYYPNGAARSIFCIELPKDIDSGTKVMDSSKDVYTFSYFNSLNDELEWVTPAYQLVRGEISNADYHANYGSFCLVANDCDGSHFSGTLDCTLTSFTYTSGDYHYDGSDTIEIKDVEFDFTEGSVHPVLNELGISKEGKSTGSSGTSGSQQSDDQSCSYCYGLGWRECGVCGSFGMCGVCDGFGHFTRYTSKGMEYKDCSACRGTGQCSNCGYSGRVTCTFCHGTGRND